MEFLNKYLNGINKIFYYTALHFAVENGNTDIVKLLLSISNIDINKQTIIKYFNI